MTVAESTWFATNRSYGAPNELTLLNGRGPLPETDGENPGASQALGCAIAFESVSSFNLHVYDKASVRSDRSISISFAGSGRFRWQV
jgi:hypothetical protein